VLIDAKKMKSTSKNPNRKITQGQKVLFAELQNKVMKGRFLVLKKLSKMDLITWAAYLETTLACERIVHKVAMKKRAEVGGGMKVTEKALTSKALVPKAIGELVTAGKKVTYNAIKDVLETYPEIKRNGLEAVISENAIKTHLKDHNRATKNLSLLK
jgi:hypothetical protein